MPRVRTTLLLLFLINTLNFLDRTLFGVLLEPIKHDLAFDDFQLGLLGGPAFAILYSLLAIPFGRLADRGYRVAVLSGVTALWSVMTGICGAAGSFGQMFFGRLGVSIGEAGCAPAAHSFLAESFPPSRRGGAISMFTAGTSAGTLLAAFAGAAVAAAFSWRIAFFACGVLGLAVALAIVLLVREPTGRIQAGQGVPLSAAFRIMRSKRSYVHLCAAMSLATLTAFALIRYMTSFLIRAHHLPLRVAAGWAGILNGGIAFFVTLGAGWLIDRLRAKHANIGTLIPAWGLTFSACFYIAGFIADDLRLTLTLLVIATVCTHGFVTAGYTSAQDIAPAGLRSTASGLLMLIVGLVGFAIGSPLVGLVSNIVAGAALQGTGLDLHRCARAVNDLTCAAAQAKGLRWGLIAVVLPLPWSAAHFWMASRTIAAETER